MTAGPAIRDSVREAPGSLALSVAVAVVPGVSIEALRTSLFALAAAIDAVERLRYEVEVVIADATSDPTVARLLAAVDGATVITVPDSSIARAWTAACERTSAPAVSLISPKPRSSKTRCFSPRPWRRGLVRRSTFGADEDVAALLERHQALSATRGVGPLRSSTRCRACRSPG